MSSDLLYMSFKIFSRIFGAIPILTLKVLKSANFYNEMFRSYVLPIQKYSQENNYVKWLLNKVAGMV